MTLNELRDELEQLADPVIAKKSARYFKSGPGEYAEGMQLRGIHVPPLRALAKTHVALPTEDAFALLQSDWHEDRLCALYLLVQKFERKQAETQVAIYQGYLARTAFVNNWDLVDSSAPQIVGGWLVDRATKTDRGILDKLIASSSLWERRIAVLATFTFIRKGEFADTLRLITHLLDANEGEDLMHKASGWMLREFAKRDKAAVCAFLDQNVDRMPRTMLRYAIERFSKPERQAYLAQKKTRS